MSDTAPEFQPRRFRPTVPFYARYRLGYPDRLISRVAERAGLVPGERVLDLGCGPGLLALPFARFGASVLAVDPEPDMLAAGREAARAEGLGVDFRDGSSFDLPDDARALKLVTMGRSFHWMDRAETLRMLDARIEPGGAIALFFDQPVDTRENRWREAIRETSSRFGLDAERHRRPWRGPDARSHESYLFDSAFCDLESIGVFVRHTLSADDIVGRVLSLSVSSPERLGAKRDAFEADLHATLAAFAPDGRFTEIAELRATIARRPCLESSR